MRPDFLLTSACAAASTPSSPDLFIGEFFDLDQGKPPVVRTAASFILALQFEADSRSRLEFRFR